MQKKTKVRAFKTEGAEALWWSEQGEKLTEAFKTAAVTGKLRRGSVAAIAREQAAGITPTTTIRLDKNDISRARTLAAKRGLRYQSYLKILIHEALAAEEKKLAG